MTLKVGLVGAGNLGFAVGQRLITQGIPLSVFDTRPEAIAALAAEGASSAESLKELAGRNEIIMLCLSSREMVHASLCEICGLPPGKRPRICIDISTIGRSAAIESARLLEEAGVGYVEAPVSGGPSKAVQGTITVMVAGKPSSIKRVGPVLDALSSNVFCLGAEPGSAQMLKLVNNALAATNLATAMEAVVCGVKAGLDLKMMLDVINVSSGQNSATTGRMLNNVLPRQFSSGAKVEIIDKDLKLFLEEAQALCVPVWILNQVSSMWGFVMSQGDGPRDVTILLHHFERWAGVTVDGQAMPTTTSQPTSAKG